MVSKCNHDKKNHLFLHINCHSYLIHFFIFYFTFIFIFISLATETNVSDKMIKFGPIVEASIPTVIVTKENNRQQNTEKENIEEEEEFQKENENENGKNNKTALKPNEKIRSRGMYI